jgi:Ras-related GTP-binding protein A/B
MSTAEILTNPVKSSPPSKVLLMGRAGAGKTSMRSIIFANYQAKETGRLHPTNQIEHSSFRFMGNLSLSLWDCGGQDVFMENYFESQKDHIFKNVKILIYVISSAAYLSDLTANPAESKEMAYYKNTIESLKMLSPSARIYVLVHKSDLISPTERGPVYTKLSDQLKSVATGMQVETFQTSIWDETLYKAWSRIVYTLMPNIDQLETELGFICDTLEADEVVLFEKSTFLVIAHATRKSFSDSLRFEKISNIIKQFKLSINKEHNTFTTMDITTNQFRALVDRFSPNTFILVVTSKNDIQPGATVCNISAARAHFVKLTQEATEGSVGMYL